MFEFIGWIIAIIEAIYIAGYSLYKLHLEYKDKEYSREQETERLKIQDLKTEKEKSIQFPKEKSIQVPVVPNSYSGFKSTVRF